tara:strand:+ start:142 stop:546 length:405 start_codon:yes stop_codon:yes gene_type:complete
VSKEGTLHLTYWREYEDSEERYDPYFKTHYTIFRNVPLSQLKRLNSKELKAKVKVFCDKNYKETASNFTGVSGVDMIVGSEYYKTYDDVYPDNVNTPYSDSGFYEDYGQKWNGRQFFKHDFMPEFTNSLTNPSY